VSGTAGSLPLFAGLEPELGAVRAALAGEPALEDLPASPTLDSICSLFGLSCFERQLLVLAAGAEIDPAISAHCRERASHGAPTAALALSALPGPHWSALSTQAPLRRFALLAPAGEGPLLERPLRIEERVLDLLAGVDHLDPRLDGIAAELRAGAELVPSREALAARVAEHIAGTCGRGEWPLVQVGGGADARTRNEIAAAALASAGMRTLLVVAAALPDGAGESCRLARLCSREAALARAGVVVDATDLGGPDRGPRALVAFAAELEGAIVVSAPEPVPGLRASLAVRLEPGSARERRAVWEELMPVELGLNGELDAIAAQFELEPGTLRDAAGAALGEQGGDADSAAEVGRRLWAACRERARPDLDDLARHIKPRATWSRLVLPKDRLRTLRELATQVRQRARVHEEWGFDGLGSTGLGIGALFSGPSGTGKTMAAEVVANELGLDLYRIDLSAVVSKYIGETEKNLRRVFDAAERGSAVLLFDEADALFGKRTEVRDSHDRFANIEVSYLLQRMETYRGLAILTTNQRRALDAAFLRRLRFVVDFPFPDAAQRAEIWRRTMPEQAPRSGLDAERLAQLAVAGGNIRNIALGAASLAADSAEPIGMIHVARAARTEYAKLEREPSDVELKGWS
jgi:hypothetical protein